MDRALALADWNGFAQRRAEAAQARAAARHRARQLRRSNRRHAARAGRNHCAARRPVDVVIGTLSSGQGHETSFAQCVDRMARRAVRRRVSIIDPRHRHRPGRRRLAFRPLDAARRHRHGQGRRRDHRQRHARSPPTARSRRARHRYSPTGASPSKAPTARSACSRSPAAAQNAKRPAGRFARAARGRMRRDRPDSRAFPFGAHVCEVEIDPETGAVEIVRYTAVDDVGRAINPLILHGQTHGGIAQGVGQALLGAVRLRSRERAIARQPPSWITPCRAPIHLPFLVTDISEVPSPTNPARRARRRRGRHDAGASPPSSMPIVDALAEFGVQHIEMPVTPERIWRAIEAGKFRAQSRTSSPIRSSGETWRQPTGGYFRAALTGSFTFSTVANSIFQSSPFTLSTRRR